MTVEASIYTLLRSMVADRVYPDVAPLGTTLPYITYQQVGGEALSFVDNTLPSKRNGRFQVNVWSNSRLNATTLAVLIENAFYTTTAMQARPIGGPVALYDEETNYYGSTQDFSIWSDR